MVAGWLALSFWLTTWALPASVAADERANTSFTSRYDALLQRQAALYFEPELAQLRVEFMYNQLWALYSDPLFNAWSHELTTRGQRLELMSFVYGLRIPQSYPTGACQSQPDPWNQACLIAQVQEAAVNVSLRASTVSEFLKQTPWFNDWTQRWQKGIGNATQALEEQFAQLREDFPTLVRHTTVHEFLVQKAEEVLANTTIMQKLARQFQEFRVDVQDVLSQRSYVTRVNTFNLQVQQLVKEHAGYQQLQTRGKRLTTELSRLQQNIHAVFTNCRLNYEEPDCSNPDFNWALRNWLPFYNASSNNLLLETAQFQEDYSHFWYTFSTGKAFRKLSDNLQEQLREEVLPDLQEAQQQFTQDVQAIPEARQFGKQLRRIDALAQELEQAE
jgi:hypothetical protein